MPRTTPTNGLKKLLFQWFFFAPVPQYIHFTLTFILCPPKHFRILGLPKFESITWQSTNCTNLQSGNGTKAQQLTILNWEEWKQMLKSLI